MNKKSGWAGLEFALWCFIENEKERKVGNKESLGPWGHTNGAMPLISLLKELAIMFLK